MLARAVRRGIVGAAISTLVQLTGGEAIETVLADVVDTPTTVTPADRPDPPERRSLYVPPAERWRGQP